MSSPNLETPQNRPSVFHMTRTNIPVKRAKKKINRPKIAEIETKVTEINTEDRALQML